MSYMNKEQKKSGFHFSSRTRKRRNNGRPWSEYDLQRLIELYPKTHNFELARMLGRTDSAIIAIGERLGLRKKYDDEFKPIQPLGAERWTDAEIRTLKKMYLTHPFEEISDELDRTAGAISRKLHNLKLKKYKFWTKKEDGYLRRNFATKTASELSEKLGRTRQATLSRARQLGLERKYDWWTEKEIGLLKKYYNKMTRIELAQKLRRTPKAVARRIERLGLIQRRKWNSDEERVLIQEYKKGTPLKEIGEIVGKSKIACFEKIRRIKLQRAHKKGANRAADRSDGRQD